MRRASGPVLMLRAASPNGSELNKNHPRVTQGGLGGGVLGVRNSKIWSNYQTAGPIGTKFGAHMGNSSVTHVTLFQLF